MNTIKFSIIVPTFNLGHRVQGCFASLCALDYPSESFEILVVDDCSTDDTLREVRTFWAAHDRAQVRIFETPRNLGPGGARQVGLDQALGEWVFFLDADDSLLEHSLRTLSDLYEDSQNGASIDLIAYNWCFGNAVTKGLKEGRRDLNCLRGSKAKLIEHYLGMEMDGSVIYTAFRRTFLSQNRIGFRNGFHEDVDFIFKAYCHANSIAICDETLYQKYNRPESIIHTMSERHIEGVFCAWFEIFRFGRDFHNGAVECPATEMSIGSKWNIGCSGLEAH